ncbi:hypothetical protein PM082_014955 [Marasmius tenuissimus]|nr:hypothetical protein PM082_014955 [Marasmius tenuissimus]
MRIKRSPVFVSSLAAVTPTHHTKPVSEYNTSDLQCCETTGTVEDPSIAAVLAAIGVDVLDLNVLIGLTCFPITAIGGGNGACSADPVCCEHNSHGKTNRA